MATTVAPLAEIAMDCISSLAFSGTDVIGVHAWPLLIE
jgi:hypothetical protein